MRPVPSGPTLISRLPPLATTSTSRWTSWVPVRVGGGFPGVVPEGAAQAAAQLPGPAGCGVGDGVLVGLDVVVEVRPRPGQFPSQPRRRLQRQDDVPQVQSADDAVARDPDLGPPVVGHSVGHGGPVHAAAVVQPHPQPLFADGLDQVADQVPLRPVRGGHVRVGDRGGPQRVAVQVPGDHNHVPRAGPGEEPCPDGTGRASSDVRSGSKVTAFRPAVASVTTMGYPHYGPDPGSSTARSRPAQHDRIHAARLSLAAEASPAEPA
jgi:hypothetical protein